jgi:ABC-type transporter Mla MlaB component
MARQLTVEFAIGAPLARADLAALCARVCRLLERTDPVVAFCNVGGLSAPDAIAVDALARLALVARRHGCEVRLRGACPELLELVGLMGLADVLREA